ncbi:MAG: uracil-DNA glycosylase [Candidatus Dependentiae bacterium]
MNLKIYKQQLLEELYEPYKNSNKLLVQGGSNRIIFGEGSSNANLMFIGEAPGAKEDELQRPFVGRSGKLLDKILQSANVRRKDVFITNIVKVRPPKNRKPYPDELHQGRNLLFAQIQIIQPKVICTLGASALEGLLDTQISISQVRGKYIKMKDFLLLPTFHPAYILRDPKRLPTLTEDIIKAIEESTL